MTTTEIRSLTFRLTTSGAGSVEVTATDRGEGNLFLLLHGGGGPQTMTGFAELLSNQKHARVIVPTHPGFGGTHRPDALNSVKELAVLYVALLDDLDLSHVTVVGNSIGGWIAAEIGLLASPRVSSVVVVDAVGIDVPDHPVADFFSLTLDQVAQLSYHDPIKFRIDPTTLPPSVQAAMPGNRASLATYAGTLMTDPTLAGRLAGTTVPTLVVWGEADQIADPDYGRAFANAIPGASFQLLTATGHLPQIETPEKLLDLIWDFAERHPKENLVD